MTALPGPRRTSRPRRTRRPGRAGSRRSGRTGRRGSRTLRERMAAEGVDAYFGARREHMRWVTGFTLAEGEDKVAGQLGAVPASARTTSWS